MIATYGQAEPLARYLKEQGLDNSVMRAVGEDPVSDLNDDIEQRANRQGTASDTSRPASLR